MVVEIGYHTVHLFFFFLRILRIPLLGQIRLFVQQKLLVSHIAVSISCECYKAGAPLTVGAQKRHDFARMHANKTE